MLNKIIDPLALPPGDPMEIIDQAPTKPKQDDLAFTQNNHQVFGKIEPKRSNILS
jgi:hypothetical protein